MNMETYDLDNIEDYKSDYDKAEYLMNTLIGRCTNGTSIDEHYNILRNYFLRKPYAERLLPKWVRKYRDLKLFWEFIKEKIDNYKDRRIFIKSEFEPLLAYLDNELLVIPPNTNEINKKFEALDSTYIMDTWNKALERRIDDPEGAITSARTLLESVLKSILEKFNISYKNDGDLTNLYKLASKELNLSPSEHKEQVFRQILGGCTSVVNGMASLRNEFGDSHGKSGKVYKPSTRHSALAVNLSGSMCIFLLETYEIKKSNRDISELNT